MTRDPEAEDPTDGQEPEASENPADEQLSGDTGDTVEQPVDAAALAGSLKEAQEHAADNWNNYLRVMAELDNTRKRAGRDLEAARKYGLEKFAAEMLSVKDSLEMGLDAADTADADSLLEGKKATLKLMETVLAKFGVEEIDPQGEPFDPEYHEAMTVQESAELEPDSVLMVVQKGYRIHQRLLRPARVVVSKEPAEPD